MIAPPGASCPDRHPGPHQALEDLGEDRLRNPVRGRDPADRERQGRGGVDVEREGDAYVASITSAGETRTLPVEKIEMTFVDAVSGESNTLKGFVTADGDMMVLRYLESDGGQGYLFRALGMVIAVKQ